VLVSDIKWWVFEEVFLCSSICVQETQSLLRKIDKVTLPHLIYDKTFSSSIFTESSIFDTEISFLILYLFYFVMFSGLMRDYLSFYLESIGFFSAIITSWMCMSKLRYPLNINQLFYPINWMNVTGYTIYKWLTENRTLNWLTVWQCSMLKNTVFPDKLRAGCILGNDI